jgi:hypothetical protein
MFLLFPITVIFVLCKIPVTGNNTKYNLKGKIQTTSYKKQFNLPFTRNNTKYQLQGTMERYNMLGTIQNTPATISSTSNISLHCSL